MKETKFYCTYLDFDLINSSYNIKTWHKLFFLGAVLFCLSGFFNGPVSLIGGFAFSLFFGHPFLEYNKKAINWLLKIAVVGLGFGMNIQKTLVVSHDGLILTIASISFTLITGWLIGKSLNLHKHSTHLISSGTAICGGSAIAAIAPILKASEKNISVSLGVIFLLNSLALLIFPPIGQFLNLSQYEFGMWAAIAIHDTSSVVGAAHAYGSEALEVATTVKLARALWIIPLSFLTVFLFKRPEKSIKIPWFIFFFIGAILVNSFLEIPEIITQSITTTSKSFLVLTLFLIGAGLSIERLKEAGLKPMILGSILWILISVLSLLAIKYY